MPDPDSRARNLKLPNLRLEEDGHGLKGRAVMIPDQTTRAEHGQSGDGVAGGNSRSIRFAGIEVRIVSGGVRAPIIHRRLMQIDRNPGRILCDDG